MSKSSIFSLQLWLHNNNLQEVCLICKLSNIFIISFDMSFDGKVHVIIKNDNTIISNDYGITWSSHPVFSLFSMSGNGKIMCGISGNTLYISFKGSSNFKLWIEDFLLKVYFFFYHHYLSKY